MFMKLHLRTPSFNSELLGALTSTVHREVEKLTKFWQIFLKLHFSTNNSRSSNQVSVPENPLPKLSNAH